MRKNIVLEKSIDLACLISDLCEILNEKKYWELSGQLFRSSHSIGANIHEAQGAQSKADFNAKLHISLKEANETEFWLTIIERKGLVSNEQFFDQCWTLNKEVLKLLTSILNTSKPRS